MLLAVFSATKYLHFLSISTGQKLNRSKLFQWIKRISGTITKLKFKIYVLKKKRPVLAKPKMLFGENFTQSNTAWPVATIFKIFKLTVIPQSLIARKASDGKSSTSSYINHISTAVISQELRETTKKGKKQQKKCNGYLLVK